MSEKNESRGFDDNFVEDETITPNYLQRKIAPQTCAISKQELVKLLKSDTLQVASKCSINSLFRCYMRNWTVTTFSVNFEK